MNYMIIDLAAQQPTIKSLGDYLFARQGDNRRPLPVWFRQSGQPFALDGYSVEWDQTDSGNNPLTVSGTTIAGAAVGQVIFYFPARAFAVAGTVTGHFLIKKADDGTVISSIDLTFEVTKDNVLMNIDTTPFMNDWEAFKTSIKNDTDGLQSQIDGFNSTIAGANSTAQSIEALVNANQVAKSSDLDSYLKNNVDGTVNGIVTANDFKNQSGDSFNTLKANVDQLITPQVQSSIPLKTGPFLYNLSDLDADQKPPYLSTADYNGYGYVIFRDSQNYIINFPVSGWVLNVINGSKTWSNNSGIMVAWNETVKKGSTLQLVPNSDTVRFEVNLRGEHLCTKGSLSQGAMSFIDILENAIHGLYLEYSYNSSSCVLTINKMSELLNGTYSENTTDSIQLGVVIYGQ
ncbi:BppU family phage baseplate upper protein [Oenococcus oeni]